MEGTGAFWLSFGVLLFSLLFERKLSWLGKFEAGNREERSKGGKG